ncbi:MAG: tripartite tricarboxylate transporter substrate binding protein [Betaproteobacteria bacterium]|nr:MAG: tripartite tricarboxylate transporter substrate binding protein [Betaproteobacteria bacterium]
MAPKLVLLLLTVCWLGAPSTALAQTWPSKPIRIIAPFPPGGSVDQVSRILGAQLTTQLGQQVIVDNRSGASGSIGTAAAAKSQPDGYTFVVVFDTHAVNPSLIPNLPFDTLKDLAPVMLIGTSPMVLAANPNAPFKTFKDVVAAAKRKASAVSFGSIGSGSLGHLAMTQLANRAGLEFNHVPYKGGGPLVADAVAGHVPLMIGTVFLATPQIEAKALVPLAVTSAKRYPGLPNVPTIAEEGFPGFEAEAWWGFLAPAGTPQSIIARMHAELTKALKVPAVAEHLTAQGMTLTASPPDKLQSFIADQIMRWAKVVRDNKINAGE